MDTMRMNKPFFPDPHLAKAYAALQSTLLGLDMGLTKIILEGDTLNVVNKINGANENLDKAGMIILDVKNSLTRFESWQVKHVNKSSNKAAHCLAKDALSKDDACVELEEFPSCIATML